MEGGPQRALEGAGEARRRLPQPGSRTALLRRMCVRPSADDRPSSSPPPHTLQAALCRIPRRRVSAAEARSGVGQLRVTSCAICLTDFQRNDDVRELKGCCHAFHTRCADNWLWRHQRCPMCRTPLAGSAAAAAAASSTSAASAVS